ncbi:MAG: T9SS type A sorting domain-containing protein [Balneolaceae bacterium]
MISRYSLSSGALLLPLLFLFAFFATLLPQNITAQTSPAEGNLQIIAVMVEFQPDENRFTSGDGTFDDESLPYLEHPGTNIDPLPHNREYFEAHLEFARNYFERQSGNRLSIHYQVLPDIYRLEKPMESYSPVGENPALDPLADLAKDAWEKVAEDGELPVSISPQDNIAFAIFHAGVGRDIELKGTTLDKTPQDIPSVYLDQEAFRTLSKDAGFTGFPISNGNLLVDNTLILPRTLSRAGEDISGETFVLPLSINGMVTAQIGNHLGLPDLFNTETGESGIGRFGLMDGAGIFAYNGLFPPELSAWEKIYLGWETPFTVEYQDNSLLSLPAASLREAGSIAKIPISSDEYFLVENRHRDPDGAGVTLTIQTPDGSLQEITLTNNDTEFTSQEPGFDEHLPAGVVVDVSNFDFALPGDLGTGPKNSSNTDDQRELNGGILIWHIDEAVIRNKLGIEGINSDPARRGISLKEADGAQDIGNPTAIGITQNEATGSAFDFWWAGNNASVAIQSDTISLYQNRFGPDTTPNNQSNSGGPSFFELYDFSENLPAAGFRIRKVSPFTDYEPAASGVIAATTFTPFTDEYWKNYPLSMVPYGGNNILIPAPDGIFFYDLSEDRIINSDIQVSGLQQPVTEPLQNLFSVAEHPLQNQPSMQVKFFQWDDENGPDETWSFLTDSNTGFLSLTQSSIVDIDRTSWQADLQNNELIRSGEAPVQKSEQAGEYQSIIQNNTLTLFYPGGSESFPLSSGDEFRRLHTGLIQEADNDPSFYLITDRSISIFRPEDNYSREVQLIESDFIDWPAFTDFTENGSIDFIFIDHTSNQIIGKNRNGASLDNFPIQSPAGARFIGTPLIADIDGDGKNNLMVTVQDEYTLNIYAYNEKAEQAEGFPLYVGGVTDAKNQPVHPVLADNKLVAVSHKGDVKAWRFPGLSNIQWGSRYGNTNNKVTGFVDSDSQSEIDFTLLNKEETYNWPNPAGNETTLRYQTGKPAEITILITSLSGRTVYNRTFESTGGVPEEILLDTSPWASGGYFALVTAKADDKTERKVVKIAIVK